jgi:hypothetical protein
MLYLFVELLAFLALLVAEKVNGITFRPNIVALNEPQIIALTNLVEGASRKYREMAPDPELGWRPVSEANSAGMRDDREYTLTPDESVLRISAFGDSITYSSDVSLENSWVKKLASLDKSLEVFNYGSGAYGLDQAYLRYKRNKHPYKADIVLIGYMSENIARHVNVFRPFYSPAYGQDIFTKPRYLLSNARLELLPNPISSFEDQVEFLQNHRQIIPRLGKYDYHYQVGYNSGPLDFSPTVRLLKIFSGLLDLRLLRPIYDLDGNYSSRSEAFALTKAIFDDFYREVLEDESLPIIVVFPDLNDQSRSRSGGVSRYQPLLNYFDEKGYAYIDIMSAIKPYEERLSIEDLTVDWGHFSPRGNVIISRYMFDYLVENFSLNPENVRKQVYSRRLEKGLVGSASSDAGEKYQPN